MITTDDKILEKNKTVMGGVKFALKRECASLFKEEQAIVYPKPNYALNSASEKVDTVTKGATYLTGVFPAATGTVAIVNSLLSAVPTIMLISSLGMEHTPESIKITESLTDFVSDRMTLFTEYGVITLKGLVPVFLFGGANVLNKKVMELVESAKERKFEKQEAYSNSLLEEMTGLYNIIEMITDITKDKNDISLNFIREFLSNVDLSENSRKFNFEVLSRLTEYRVARLKEEREESGRKEADDKFLEFVSFIETADKDYKRKEVSPNFTKNEYVQSLIKNYGSNFTESNNQKKGIKRKIRL